MRMKYFLPFFILLFFGCSTQKIFKNFIAKNQCYEASKIMVTKRPEKKILYKGKEILGSTLSYTATGAAALTEGAIYLTGGIVKFLVACSPELLISSIGGMGSYPFTNRFCYYWDSLPKVIGSVPITQKTFNGTKKLRCPPTKRLNNELKEVISCYQSKGDKKSLSLAKKQINHLIENQNYFSCLSTNDKDFYISKWEKLKKDTSTNL